MKHFSFSNLSQTITKAVFAVCLVGSSLGLQAQSGSMEYAAADVDALVADLAAGTYEEYILSESGGVYSFYKAIPSKSFIIRAKDGLAEMPMIKYNGEANGQYDPFFKIKDFPEVQNVTIKGIKFSGEAPIEDFFLITRIYVEGVTLTIDSCEIVDFVTGNGFVRLEGNNININFTNTLVSGCHRGIRVGAVDVGDIVFENSTFLNAGETSLIHWNSFNSGSAKSITINQCTVYESSSQAMKLGKVTMPVEITNCVFDSIPKVSLWVGDADNAGPTAEMSYCYVGIKDTLPEAVTVSNAIEVAPQYKDALNWDLTLLNAADLKGKDGVTIIGDSRWVSSAPSAIAKNEIAELVTVYSDRNAIQVSLGQLKADVSVYGINGVLAAKQLGCTDVVSFDVPQGVYLVKVQSAIGSTVLRVVKQ